MDTEKIYPLLKGLITNIPGIERYLLKRTGGTDNPRYCYSIWLRHLVYAYKNKMDKFPQTVAELGPGDTPGIGLAALLCGAEKYYSLDINKYWDKKRSTEIFDQLLQMFKNRENIPDSKEFPLAYPTLDNYEFPHNILTDEILNKSLDHKRVEAIRNELSSIEPGEDCHKYITYFAPWSKQDLIKKESVDFILSQAVLEHVESLEETYQCLYTWLKADGMMSHTIDFKSHGYAKQWNGHWTFSDLQWKITKGRRKFLINREPYSTHIQLLKKNNFKIIFDINATAEPGIQKRQLSKRFKNLSHKDFTTTGCFVQAVKK